MPARAVTGKIEITRTLFRVVFPHIKLCCDCFRSDMSVLSLLMWSTIRWFRLVSNIIIRRYILRSWGAGNVYTLVALVVGMSNSILTRVVTQSRITFLLPQVQLQELYYITTFHGTCDHGLKVP